ncbi:hypothetical protein [Paraburkholderia sp. BCC1886]|uniref:hypothetical protein n=1 Tax=Paraburkholderia sp. BCC1886 TaxID=2562670 RepID=UPI001183D951|nr:hypothetical protein [Paraburkholderia sp. BCC1886]
MGWTGIVVLGAVIGLAGWWLHPLRRANRSGRTDRAGRARWWIGPAAGMAGAVLAAMAGNLVGLFHDGDTLEWPVCTAIALIAVTLTVGSLSRR